MLLLFFNGGAGGEVVTLNFGLTSVVFEARHKVEFEDVYTVEFEARKRVEFDE